MIEIYRYQAILKLRQEQFNEGIESLNRVLEIYTQKYGQNG